MNPHRCLLSVAAIVFGALCTTGHPGRAQDLRAEAGVAEVYTRGPMHEAFAAAIAFDPVPGLIVDVPPPPDVQEAIPAQRPVGRDVAWIPGYWAWDEELGDFVWVSGIWRNPPPGRQWVPGEWVDIGNRYQWTSGYWDNVNASQHGYLPAPPRSLETGPNGPAVSDDHIWFPGHWVHVGGRYAWRAGYWSPARPDWVWTPACYHWTPRGYVYVEGYWDYPVVRRGVVFAPVRFDRHYRSQRSLSYAPSVVITLAVLTNHLFVRPRYGHYYFGDYYDSRYRQRGYYPSFSYASDRRGYDPIYTHSRWLNRHDRTWERKRREQFESIRDHKDHRPPRLWSSGSSSRRENSREEPNIAQRWEDHLDQRKNEFRRLDSRERQRYAAKSDELRRLRGKREDRQERPDRRVAESDANTKKQPEGRPPAASKPNRAASKPQPDRQSAERRKAPPKRNETAPRRPQAKESKKPTNTKPSKAEGPSKEKQPNRPRTRPEKPEKKAKGKKADD